MVIGVTITIRQSYSLAIFPVGPDAIAHPPTFAVRAPELRPKRAFPSVKPASAQKLALAQGEPAADSVPAETWTDLSISNLLLQIWMFSYTLLGTKPCPSRSMFVLLRGGSFGGFVNTH